MTKYSNGFEILLPTYDHIVDGKLPRHTLIHKIAQNLDVDTVTEDIWESGGVRTFLTTAATLSIVSDNVNDTSSGSGARSLRIDGLDENFELISETVLLNGTTPVITTNTFIRVHLMIVTSSGTYGSNNEGIITATDTGLSSIQGTILAGRGQSRSSHYTVPYNRRALLTRLQLSVESNKTAEITVIFRPGANVTSAPFASKIEGVKIRGLSGALEVPFRGPILFEPNTDIWLQSTAEAVNTAVNSDYELLLIDI